VTGRPGRRRHLRAAAATTAAAGLLALAAGCSRPADPLPASAAADAPAAVVVERPAPDPDPPPDNAGPGGADPTGTGWALPPVDGPPPAPRLTPQPADYTTPAAVAAAYFAAWCTVRPGAAADTGVQQAIGWLTVDGWRDDQARAAAAGQPTAGVGTGCGPVQADPVTAAPATGQLAWVRIRARRVWLRDGAVIGDHQVGQVRRVVRGADGRWLVDVRVAAG